jgi:hypothetical protein
VLGFAVMTSTPTDPQQILAQSVPPESQVFRPGEPLPERGNPWFWPGVWFTLLAISSTVGMSAMVWLTRLPPLPDCQKTSNFYTDNDRFYCAKQTVRSGTDADLKAAMALVTQWPPSHPLYKESQDLIQVWSKALFAKAERYINLGDIKQATTLASQIPARAENYNQAQQAIKSWQSEWKTGTNAFKSAEQAFNAHDWQGAKRHLQTLKTLTSDYWVTARYQSLFQKVQREVTAESRLQQARDLAKSGDVVKISEALTLAQTIDVKSRSWIAAKSDIEQWADTLLQYGFQKWEQEDLAAAVDIIQKVPIDLAKAPEAQDLIHFAYAQKLASLSDKPWVASYWDLLSLTEAMRAIAQIPSSSPFYDQAQDDLKQWQQKLADIPKLQMAFLSAQLGQKVTYQAAIEQAQKIDSDRSQRVSAQTLISHWRKEIERIEDKPYLVRADQLAKGGKIPDLQAAIAQARHIRLGRVLRVEAQTKIATWTSRIQIIEDQPFLDKAQELANKNQLAKAIKEAQNIKEGRALYAQAQTLVKDWTTTLQIAEDRPILNRAQALAAQGRYSDAIAVAAQIGRGRALSREARSSIAVWDAERQAIWDAQNPPAADYSDDAAPDNSDQGSYDGTSE